MGAVTVLLVIAGLAVLISLAVRAVADPQTEREIERAIESGRVEQTAREFAARGRVIPAITLLRRAYGIDLRRAKEMVDAMDPDAPGNHDRCADPEDAATSRCRPAPDRPRPKC